MRHPLRSATLALVLAVTNAAAQYPHKNFPDTAEDYLTLGLALMNKDPNGAFHAFQEALARHPTHLRARSFLAQFYVRHRRYQKALAEFELILETDPRSQEAAAAFSESSRMLQFLGDPSSAERYLTRGIEFFPDRADLYRERHRLREKLGLKDGAKADFERARDLEIEEEWVRLAHKEAAAGNFDSAMLHLNLGIVEFPSSGRLHEVRGMISMRRQDFSQAISDFTRLIEIRPRHPWGYVLRAEALSKTGDLENALTDTNKAIDLHPRNEHAYRYRASFRRRLGDTTGAVQDLGTAIEIDPSRRDLYMERGIDRREMQDLPGALSDLEKALALAEPGQRYEKSAAECVAKSRAHRGLIRLQQGRTGDAQSDFDEAVKIDPSLESWLRAEIQKQQKR